MRYEPQIREIYQAQARRDFKIIVGLALAVLVGMIVLAIVNESQPRLACYTEEGVIYADEEDQFPEDCVYVVAR